LEAGLFNFAEFYAEVIDVSNKEEKHSRTHPAGRH
jgi:hypothetical protein